MKSLKEIKAKWFWVWFVQTVAFLTVFLQAV